MLIYRKQYLPYIATWRFRLNRKQFWNIHKTVKSQLFVLELESMHVWKGTPLYKITKLVENKYENFQENK